MAVTTFKDFYNLVKNNIVYFEYQKGDSIFNIKGTLLPEYIPSTDEDLRRYNKSIIFSDWNLGLWVGTDSDRLDILEQLANDNPACSIPDWLKVYSTNYEIWINIEIAKINSLQVVDS